MPTRPTNSPLWATNHTIQTSGSYLVDGYYVVKPDNSKIQQGYEFEEGVPLEWLNFNFQNLGLWCDFLDDAYVVQHNDDGTHSSITGTSLTVSGNIKSTAGYLENNDPTAANTYWRSGVIGTGSLGTRTYRGSYLDAVDTNSVYNKLTLTAWSGAAAAGTEASQIHLDGAGGDILVKCSDDMTFTVGDDVLWDITGTLQCNPDANWSATVGTFLNFTAGTTVNLTANAGDMTLAASDDVSVSAPGTFFVDAGEGIRVDYSDATPVSANHFNARSFARAWAHSSAGGTVSGSFNLTGSKTATGEYNLSFVEPMPNANYSATVTAWTSNAALATVSSLSTSGFKVYTFDIAGANADTGFNVVVHAE